MALRFKTQELLQEVELVRTATRQFLENDELLSELSFGWKQHMKGPLGSSFVWQIPEDRPLKTRVSRGQYTPGGGGGWDVYATLSFKWMMRVVRAGAGALVEPYDLASTVIKVFRIVDGGEPDCVAEWQFDVADAASPGCHFHLQVNWSNDKQLDVPRIPIPIVLPTDALEFLLGELFQDEWPQHRLRQQTNSSQHRRLRQILHWMHQQLTDAKDAPWVALKSLKPHQDHGLFIS